MTDKPTPTTDLLKRCAEIHEWRSTGVLSGEALRDYAKRKWPDRHDTLQMAEHETVTEALALLAKWGQPAQAAEPVAREPLTDAQIAEMMRDTWGCASIAPRHALAFARAVERAHGITQAGAVPLTCDWTHNEDDGFWETACGEAWRFDDGGPGENNMHFCHSCGNSLRIKGGQHGTE